MNLADTSFFGMLRSRLDQLSQRQRLISENIANASTPGYVPRDLDTTAFDRALAQQANAGGGLRMARTNPGHMAQGGGGAAAQPRVVTNEDSETTIDGNAVVLEDQMARAAETRMAFETGVALYQKGLQLVRLAAKPPGR
ncbi:flagellar basal-body rod protein FlgB [alpha proteobacterium U9-1i]|nr:flagellar basal-body rod protein FlgB [alpha proteobacterium U9-1i]